MTEWFLIALAVANLLLLLWLLRRPADGAIERLERELRDEVARSGSGTRQEIGQTLAVFQQTLLAQAGDVARTQNEQIDSFRTQLAAMQQSMSNSLRATDSAQAGRSEASREAQDAAFRRFADTLNEQGNSVPSELGTRVNKPAPKVANPKVQVVQFFPNPKLKKTPD